MAGVHAIIDRKVATNHVCASSGGVAGESFGRIMLTICAVFAIVDADDAGVAMTCNGRLEHRLGPVSAFAETYHGRVSNYNCTIGMTIGGSFGYDNNHNEVDDRICLRLPIADSH